MKKGTQLWLEALKEEGVDTIFGYPGGYVLDIFDELYKQNDIRLILPRHEQAAVHAADAYARATGKVGVCVATSGPGATNLVTGIANANYDSVPLVCFTGQVPLDLIGNDAFQEVDFIGITRSVCKYGVMVRDRKDLGRIIKEAFYIARTGKPGPVVVDLPSNIMKEVMKDSYPAEVHIRGYKPNSDVHVGQLKRALKLLRDAERPLFLCGGGINIAHANEAFRQLAEIVNIPVITTVMGKGAIPTNHSLYVGSMGMHGCYAANKAVSECDLLFSIGTRFNDRITGKISEFAKEAKIVHIDIDTAAISRNIKVDVPVVGDAKLAIEKMLTMVKQSEKREWVAQVKKWKEEYPLGVKSGNCVNPQRIIEGINNIFDDFIAVTDVGQHQMWTTQFLELDNHKKLLTSGGLGAMGFGFPAAIGAQLAYLEKQVICITGDGGFQMNMAEMATAVAWELPIVVLVFNNSFLGMVRQQQQYFCEKHYYGTCLKERKSCQKTKCHTPEECPPYLPDFLKFAESYNVEAYRVTEEEQIEQTLKIASEKAKQNKAPVLVEFILERYDIVLPIVRHGGTLDNMILEEN
ncbi:biosynthetic-type acetolactate synthase large subunit [Clostridium sp. MD294]|uniref:biosynthetic-type acetolactate synthase large subunit n=1 Tax=Clostridium sp. MD294 TaxID=97138 RepID=UPI0002CA839C|nr:biosynthetic-type acetolactate synthase large subunit [Clostridium sp. MD294]NDO47564.1 biosynthetic-type acetolactate synthase large subunit [Clostridium sp. MD294]USF29362.1 Acetolactate synthase large subunit [Clostridium sp. MD294]